MPKVQISEYQRKRLEIGGPVLIVIFVVLILGALLSYTLPNKIFQIQTKVSGFCGSSTNGACSTDSDCMKGGCSGQVCQGKSEEPIITTCEFRECYDSVRYGVSCGCVSNKCQWS